jgi:pre-mRNA-processing factor 17
MDLVNNYGSSDEEDNAQINNTNTSLTVNAAPDTGFDVRCYNNNVCKSIN